MNDYRNEWMDEYMQRGRQVTVHEIHGYKLTYFIAKVTYFSHF